MYNSLTAVVCISPHKQNELMWLSLNEKKVRCCLLSRLLLWLVLHAKQYQLEYGLNITWTTYPCCSCQSCLSIRCQGQVTPTAHTKWQRYSILKANLAEVKQLGSRLSVALAGAGFFHTSPPNNARRRRPRHEHTQARRRTISQCRQPWWTGRS